jgi:hypothetical protein
VSIEEKATGRSGPGETQEWTGPRETMLANGITELVEIEEHAEFAEYIDAADGMVRATYERIVSHLEVLRSKREALNEQIALLVEKEAIWKPIINRLETGIRHRAEK